ncbi:mei5 protein [Ophiostoma piceae UAMH 11346]|uniref:Mei5 protein n=1 Tax=Ophiostoma piceae (strain UAMH 11346) TaxID=1262450 RepID=S3CDU1_OPHP1|nr:mei5 protein [Ophiostoma piceae UAMH 11346]
MAVDSAPGQDPTQVVDGLVGAIKTIAADPNYNLLANIFSEVLHLRAKNAELVSTNRNVFEQYWDFRRDLEEAQARLEAAKLAVETELAGKVQELTDMTEARDKLDSELTDTKNELSETTTTKDQLEADLASANAQLEELRASKAGLEEDLSRVSEQLEEQRNISEAAAKEITELQTTLSQCVTDLEKTRDDLESTGMQLQEVTKERDELKETLFLAESDLTVKSSRLNELDSYRVELLEQPEDMYVKILDTIWTRLFQLVEEHFRQDLDDKVLNDASCWTNLRSTEALKGPTQIPLPQSNSPVAKAMRIASVLSVLSRTLHKYIFRPFYLMKDDTELTKLLHGVEFENPSKEVNIRSTLLATLPDIQRLSAKTRVQHVVREVSWVVQHLLGALPYDSFCSALTEACIVACTEWQKIQMAKMKIEPYFGPPYDEFDWQALPLPEFEGLNVAPRRRSGVSGASSTRANSLASAKDSDMDPGDILLVVWPSMAVVENGDQQPITQGLVVTKEQATLAFKEVHASRNGTRNNGKRSRAMSIPSMAKPNITGSPRPSKAFLAAGGDEVSVAC